MSSLESVESAFWILKNYFKSNSNNKYIPFPSNTQMTVIYHNHSLKISINGVNELIYLNPETYILYSNLHLGILSFDSCHYGKWVLSFHDKPSIMHCVEIIMHNGIKVTDIQKLLSEKVLLENTILETISNMEFPQFVAEVEMAMKTNFFHL